MKYILIVIFVLCFIGGVISWGYAFSNAVITFNNIDKELKNRVYIDPIYIFRQKYFNKEGNKHRVAMLKNIFYFLMFALFGSGSILYYDFLINNKTL